MRICWKKGSISKPGWGKVRVSYGLNLDRNGNIVGILTLKTPQEVRKKTVFVPQAIEVPQPVKRSSDVKTNFLCDNATYILGGGMRKKRRTGHCNVIRHVRKCTLNY